MLRLPAAGLLAVVLLAFLPLSAAAQNDWSPQFGYGGLTGNAYDTATDADGNVYVGGVFESAGSIGTSPNVAYWDGAQWQPVGRGANDQIDAVGVATHGTTTYLYVSGRFSEVTNADETVVTSTICDTGFCAARWSAGGGWEIIGKTSQQVRTIAFGGTDRVYFGGDFTSVTQTDGSSFGAAFLAWYDASTQAWADPSPELEAGSFDYVADVVPDGNGGMYVAGRFTELSDNSLFLSDIAAFDGSTWSALGDGSSATTNGLAAPSLALAVDGTDLYVGGAFQEAYASDGSSIATNRVARWDGSTWSALGDPSSTSTNGLSDLPFHLAIGPGGDVYAAGQFEQGFQPDGTTVSARYVARWDPDAASWSTLGGGIDNSLTFTAGLAVANGRLYVGGDVNRGYATPGNFNTYVHSEGVLAWTGSAWENVKGNDDKGILGASSGGGTVEVVLESVSGLTYVGGGFLHVGNQIAHNVAVWDGAQWSALGDGTERYRNGLNGAVYAFAEDAQGNVYVGGNFTEAYLSDGSTLSLNHVARWDPDVQQWAALGDASSSTTNGVDGAVRALAFDDEGDLFMTGAFRTAYASDGSTIAASRIAKWDDTGTWQALGNGNSGTQNGLAGQGFALQVEPVPTGNGTDEDEFYIGGSFTGVYQDDGTQLPASRVAYWNGTEWEVLGTPNSGTNGVSATVRALLRIDNDLYVGGLFSEVNNDDGTTQTAFGVALWDSGWFPLGEGTFGGDVFALAKVDGDVIVGGDFEEVRQPDGTSVTAENLARWNTDGLLWKAGSDSGVRNINGSISQARVNSLLFTGQLYVGGAFSRVGEQDISVGLAIENSGSPLPVELAGLRAVADGDRVLLTWETASERNNAYFQVEAAAPEQPFAPLGIVEGTGTTSASQAYRYLTSTLTPNTYRFRLKQVDVDGSFTFSDIVTVDLQSPERLVLLGNAPNPFRDVTTIQYEIPRDAHVTLRVYDVLGRRVATLVDRHQSAGRYETTLDSAQLASGTYFYRLSAGDRTATRRMVVAR